MGWTPRTSRACTARYLGGAGPGRGHPLRRGARGRSHAHECRRPERRGRGYRHFTARRLHRGGHAPRVCARPLPEAAAAAHGPAPRRDGVGGRGGGVVHAPRGPDGRARGGVLSPEVRARGARSEEHTSGLQSPCNLVCRLLLEKKKKINETKFISIVKHFIATKDAHEILPSELMNASYC